MSTTMTLRRSSRIAEKYGSDFSYCNLMDEFAAEQTGSVFTKDYTTENVVIHDNVIDDICHEVEQHLRRSSRIAKMLASSQQEKKRIRSAGKGPRAVRRRLVAPQKTSPRRVSCIAQHTRSNERTLRRSSRIAARPRVTYTV